MTISSTYKLPGVYTSEVTSTQLPSTTTGNPVVAFIGPAIGYKTASQRSTLTGTTAVSLSNSGANSSSVTVTDVNSGTTYGANTDYTVTSDASGGTSVARKLTTLATTATTVSAKVFTFYTAQPTFNILTGGTTNIIPDGYLIKGTVACTGYTEGTDYTIDYHTGVFNVTAQTKITNGTSLTFSFEWTTAEPIELVGEASYTLSHQYIAKNGLSNANGSYTCTIVSCIYTDASGVAHAYGDTPGATSGYVEGVDFTIDYTTGEIARTASSRIPTFDDSINDLFYIAFAYSAIQSGEDVLISYHYTDSDYNTATYFDSYNALSKQYGNPWDTSTGEIQSPISMAAYIAAKNGMGGCYGVAVAGTTVNGSATTYTEAAWADAFEALTLVDGIDIIVPLSGEAAVWQLAKAHITTMASNEDERIAVIGADGSSTVVASSTLISDAEGFDDEDMWMVAPSSFKFSNPITSEVQVVPAYYMAAAVAGYCSTVPQYTPLTRKAISGFYGANEAATKTAKTNECANGLMYVDSVNGAMRVLHGRTTCTDSIVKQEANIVLTKHYIIKTMRDVFANGYVGSIINSTTLLAIKSAAQSELASLVDNHYITSYTGLTVAQNASDLTEADVSFSYVPTYAMNYIDISFTVDATSTVS